MKEENHKRILTKDQAALIAEISATYGTEPEDILFFTADLKPLLGYETSCVMLNRLLRPSYVNIEPVAPVSTDSVAYACRLQWPDGTGASAVGVANTGETIDGQRQTDQQIVWLASSRALRGALRLRGVDLLRLHYDSQQPERFQWSGPSDHRQNLLSRVHALGAETGVITGSDKRLWYKLIDLRYESKSSSDLSDEQLADFAAYLASLRWKPAHAAAA